MLIARSLLLVPANRESLLAEALESPADIVVLDLADSVPAREKAAARIAVRPAIERLRAAGKTVQIRLNPPGAGSGREDLAAAIGPGLHSIVFPGVESAAQIRELDVIIRELELHGGVRPGTTLLFPQIESAMAVLRCEDIVKASSRIAGLSLGAENYTRQLAVPRSRDGRELDHLRAVVLHTAVAYGLLPLDTASPDAFDSPALVAETELAQRLGFRGKYAAHADQVEAINRAFTPTDEEIHLARVRLAAFEAAAGRGEGSVEVDGRIIDESAAARARGLIAYAEALGAL